MRVLRAQKKPTVACGLFETGLSLFRLLLLSRSGRGSRGSRSSLSGRHRGLGRSCRCCRSCLLSGRSRSLFFLLAASGEGNSQSQAESQRDQFFHDITSFLFRFTITAQSAWFFVSQQRATILALHE